MTVLPLGSTTMQVRAGLETPSIVYLADGTTVAPDAAGRITVTWAEARALFGAGWIEIPPAPAGLGGPLASATQPGALLTLDPETGDIFTLGAS